MAHVEGKVHIRLDRCQESPPRWHWSLVDDRGNVVLRSQRCVAGMERARRDAQWLRLCWYKAELHPVPSLELHPCEASEKATRGRRSL